MHYRIYSKVYVKFIFLVPVDLRCSLKDFNLQLRGLLKLLSMHCSICHFGIGVPPHVCISGLDTRVWEAGSMIVET